MKHLNHQSNSAALSHAEPLKVIVWSHSEIAYEGLKHIIESFDGYNVITCVPDATTVSEADILIVLDEDLEIADFGGFAQCKVASPGLAIVMITSHRDKQYVLAALQAGVDSYCLLNIPHDELGVVLRAASYGATWVDKVVAEHVRHSSDEAALSLVPLRPIRGGSITANKILSARECEVIELLVQGLSNKEMATKLVISAETVKSHIRNIMYKLESADRVDTVVKAISQGLVTIEKHTQTTKPTLNAM